jgi:hypothetical protein
MLTEEKKKKSYIPPGFLIVDTNAAEAELESKAMPDDSGARAMLGLIRKSMSTPETPDLKDVKNPRYKP